MLLPNVAPIFSSQNSRMAIKGTITDNRNEKGDEGFIHDQ